MCPYVCYRYASPRSSVKRRTEKSTQTDSGICMTPICQRTDWKDNVENGQRAKQIDQLLSEISYYLVRLQSLQCSSFWLSKTSSWSASKSLKQCCSAHLTIFKILSVCLSVCLCVRERKREREFSNDLVV